MNDQTNEQFATDILQLIKSHADLKDGTLSRDTALEALGIHSLELTEIIMDVEEKYDIEIDLNTVDAWQTMRTVGDIVDAVKALMAEKP